ncbi:hypothetical protein GCM10010252_50690 [Streptomyces aureoverticillatus]|nr:hypothetical protein GCM10010252_50690 [Streptomyces aureoverticillatus]
MESRKQPGPVSRLVRRLQGAGSGGSPRGPAQAAEELVDEPADDEEELDDEAEADEDEEEADEEPAGDFASADFDAEADAGELLDDEPRLSLR